VVIGTGGFSQLFEREGVFDALIPDLVLMGLHRALTLNPGGSRRWPSSPMPSDV
jgi:type III pantothenate kinase